ncbi:deoxyribonuclease TATDN1 [Topomyia yanbarensis]|uniref:deoxyribonuclease TATDN1 n=1 Tax=Topomyia yanbarensis TaxID=2498891 RepID=UPI00273CC0AD|nr:deoxyribonuclease TATDN1 [Topomyia yanbarensis]XP_058830173.1 deoxyribonuclease TATDN1 [Topomyia yanbarensis]
MWHMFKRVINMPKIIDIGANLTDSMFQGIYGSSSKHQPDLGIVLNRAWGVGLQKIIVTCGNISDCITALKIINDDDRLFMTVGCHPTRCGEFVSDPEGYYQSLSKQIECNREKVVAIGECGLDYDRLNFCDKEIQKRYFEQQLKLATKYELPLFLHCRNAHEDFIEILKRNLDNLPKRGVVHTFDGTLEDARKLVDLGFYIGINGCSLKTEDNLKTVAEIPDDRIMVETDSPWCEIRPSHAGSKFVKTKFPSVKKKEKWEKDSLIAGRCEPAMIVQVLEVLAAVKNEPVENLVDLYYNNTMSVFFPHEK